MCWMQLIISLEKTESWLDDKQVALDKYLDKLEPNKDLLHSVTTCDSLELSEPDTTETDLYPIAKDKSS